MNLLNIIHMSFNNIINHQHFITISIIVYLQRFMSLFQIFKNKIKPNHIIFFNLDPYFIIGFKIL